LPGALSLDSITTTSTTVAPYDDDRPREWSPKKKKKIVDASKLIAVDDDTSSSSDDDGNSSGEEFSLECNPPPIEAVSGSESKQPERPAELKSSTVDQNASKLADEESTKMLEATQQVPML
jgi:hypothetical protein